MKWLTNKVGDRPFGIWLAWVALFYAAILQIKFAMYFFGFIDGPSCMPKISDLAIDWLVLIAAVVSLFLRKLISRVFAGMALVQLLRLAAGYFWPFGVLVAIVGFLGLFANRRWFDERLPNIK